MYSRETSHCPRVLTLNQYELGNLSTYQIQRPVDAIYTREVTEHMADAELDPIWQQLTRNCRYLLHTSTPNWITTEEDARIGHINVKPREAWSLSEPKRRSRLAVCYFGARFAGNDRSGLRTPHD